MESSLSADPANRRVLRWVLWSGAFVNVAVWLTSLIADRDYLFPDSSFADVLTYAQRFTLYHTAKFFSPDVPSLFAYPPAAALVYAAAYATRYPVVCFLVLASVYALGLAWLATHWMQKAKILGLTVPLMAFSFPLIFLCQRGNIEVVVLLLAGIALLAYSRGMYFTFSFLIGAAAAIKLYPILLLGLLLSRKAHLRAFLAGCATFVAITAGAIVFSGPSTATAAHGFLMGLTTFHAGYGASLRKAELPWDHSIWALVKLCLLHAGVSAGPLMKVYYAIAAVYTGGLFLRVRTLPFLNQVLFLSAAMVCLPPVSFTYTLAHLYIPLLLLVVALSQFRQANSASIALILCMGLMVPLVSLTAFADVPAGGIQAVGLAALMLVCALRPWPSGDDEEPATP